MAGKGSVVDLDGMTVAELTALRDAAEVKRLQKLDAEKNAVMAEARTKLAALGLSLDAMLRQPATQRGRKSKGGDGGTVAAKFRDPESEQTWSGRGREPAWIKGKNRDEFRI